MNDYIAVCKCNPVIYEKWLKHQKDKGVKTKGAGAKIQQINSTVFQEAIEKIMDNQEK